MAASYTMATTKQKPLGDIIGARPDPAEVLMDEQLAATVTAYLDGRLPDGEREAFEGLLQNDAGLARAVQDMRAIEAQLVKLGSDILSEPVPDALLQAFSKLDGR
jgi:anti-sigma factor RsiW